MIWISQNFTDDQEPVKLIRCLLCDMTFGR